MGKKALIVGINEYDNVNSLAGCVMDANHVAEILKKNGDRTPNFDVDLLTSDDTKITSSMLKDKIDTLFSSTKGLDICLFYFAGHGMSEQNAGYICTSETNNDNLGVPFTYIMSKVNASKAKNNIIILDSCSSGNIANDIFSKGISELPEGTTILTACEPDMYELATLFCTKIIRSLFPLNRYAIFY